MTVQTTSLSPFDPGLYLRKHAPQKARDGMRGYLLRILLDMADLAADTLGTCFHP